MSYKTPGAALILVAALLTPACGYRLSGTTSVLPEHVRNFVVMPFENRTGRPEIEQRVTEAVAQLLSRRGRYRVVTDLDDADAVLSGAVTGYRTSAVQFSPSGRATRLEAVVQVQATLRETATDELLWNQSGLLFREQFEVPETGNFFDQETEALVDIAEGVAQALVNSIFEGF